MEETQKTEVKKKLYEKGIFLDVDSLNDEVINIEFEAVDKGGFLRDFIMGTVRPKKINRETSLINKLMTGQKINSMGGCF